MKIGEGSAVTGNPYQTTFPEKFDNVFVRHIYIPDVVSSYFKYYNVVNMKNQEIQIYFSLEKKCITQDEYFSFYTTMTAINVTDLWNLSKVSTSMGWKNQP